MRGTGRAATLWRGLWFRRGMSAGLLLMAVVAVAAASIGPSYHDAAATFALRRTITKAPPAGQALHLTALSPAGQALDRSPLESYATGALHGHDRLFQSPIMEIKGTGDFGTGRAAGITWRQGACAHLTFESGRCPDSTPEMWDAPFTRAAVDRETAAARGWKAGSRVRTRLRDTGGRQVTLLITGVYTIRDADSPYWYGSPPGRGGDGAFFVAEPLQLGKVPDEVGFIGRILLPVRVDALRPGDRRELGTAVRDAAAFGQLRTWTSFHSELATTLEEIDATLGTLQVPVIVVTLQLVVLCWLLLFLLMTEVAQARAPDIALVKLRGLTGVRLLAFGLAEPVLLLLIALPLGIGLGRVAARSMAAAFLGETVTMGMPVAVWLAAAGTTAGGLVAVVIASRTALSRPVTEQWRRTAGRRRPGRGWVPEAVLLTLVAGGLAQIVGSGALSTAGRQNAVSLVVPGLLALGAALIAARALPPACRALFGRTRRQGGLGAFLALRQIARRPGGNRLTISLATSLALVVFATAAWSVTRTNHREVARVRIGAPVVLTVSPPADRTLADFVRQADPAGRSAAPVLATRRTEPGAPVTLAVDPKRFAAVAYWRPDFGKQSLASMMEKLSRLSGTPPLVHGERLRAELDVRTLRDSATKEPVSAEIRVEILQPGRLRSTEVDLGTISGPGRRTLAGTLPGCSRGCEILRVFLHVPPSKSPSAVDGDLIVRNLQERAAGRWNRVEPVISERQWRVLLVEDQEFGVFKAGGHEVPGGIRASFHAPLSLWQGFGYVGPGGRIAAVTTPGVIPEASERKSAALGLDGRPLEAEVTSTVLALPAAGEAGAVIDEAEARRVAGTVATGTVDHQIWSTPEAAPRIKTAIHAAGMTVLSERTVKAETEALGQDGPGLALMLLLVTSAAAALLAAAGAMLSLYASGRRRTYELAALRVAGARRRVLRRGLLAEQLVVLGFGTSVGVIAGLLTVWLALPSIPQFVHPPAVPDLTRAPDPWLLAGVIATATALTFAGAWLMSGAFMTRVRADQLREAPP
ncbi:FtsX-like permease family protein [Spirillospora sp. NPDC048911]|uniref:FtsX-like permease family protein n=1 Tax=Spirillospora sp. NPDC048911 TaxID=3364527 RepID=UPI00371901C0